ncbi:MAG: tetratricopeptide repeat protein [Acetobacteraceae bacterium]
MSRANRPKLHAPDQGGLALSLYLRGMKLLERGALADATPHFRRAARLMPDNPEYRARLSETCFRLEQLDEAEREMRAAIELVADDPDLHACLGRVLARRGRLVEAVQSYQRAMALDPSHCARAHLVEAKGMLSQSIHRWHLPMLGDAIRNDAFQAATVAAARPDDVVLDIGTGSGLLAMMAARAGARHVYACEMEPNLADLARLVIEANGFASRITVIPRQSTDMVLGRDMPERATLLVTETFDSLLIGEGALESLNHAHEHLLTPDARVIPASGTVRGQIVSLPRLKALHPLKQLCGFDLSAFATHALEKQFYPIAPEHEDWTPLAPAFDVIHFDFTRPVPTRRDWTVPVTVEQSGTLQALLLWFELHLDGTTHLSSGPGGGLRHWNAVVFLFDAERDVAAGERLALRCRMGDMVMHFAA